MHTILSTSRYGGENPTIPLVKECRMAVNDIIKVLLDRCQECRQSPGKTVSFTVSGIARNDHAEGKVAVFFWETFGVKVHRGGNAQGRHFSFTFTEAMRQPLAAPVPERRSRPKHTETTRRPFAFAS